MQTQDSNEISMRSRWWAIVDVIVVLAFVLIGRENHEVGNAFVDVLRTAAPFLIGLAAGWFTASRWRKPLDPRTGVAIAAVTVSVGLAVRRIVFGDGIALPFIIVTSLFVVAGLVGWRMLIAASGRLSRR